jgi:hypothetical protein
MSNDAASTDNASRAGKNVAAAAATAKMFSPSAAGVVWIFTITTFISALLLFSIQPLFAKMVLPILGGAPSVWAVALCFFQGALLAGYSYAHYLNRHLATRYAGFVHLGIAALAMLALPIGLPSGWREPPPGDPYFWQLGLFTVAIGLPFLAVAANAPLLQAWFARTGHPDGRDPYFLYAASNLGSLIALLGYPFVLEPAFGLTALSQFWTIGFVVLWLAIAVCFFTLNQLGGTNNEPAAALEPDAADAAPPAWPDRLSWIGLAMVPAALLTAYTTHIATDVASAPLIWVLPLSLYLLTFVLVFRDRPIVLVPVAVALAITTYLMLRSFGIAYLHVLIPLPVLLVAAAGVTAAFVWVYLNGTTPPRKWLLWAQLAAVVLALLQLSQTRHDTWIISAATGVAAFFLSGMVAHRTLYESRPAARYLTQFYLFMSLGGVLGGLFAALIAPRLFSEVLEYPILLALTLACRPGVNVVALFQSTLALVGQAIGARTPPLWKHKVADRQELLKFWVLVACGILAVYWLPSIGQKIGWSFGEYGPAAVLALAFGIAVIALSQFPARQLVAGLLMCLAVVALPSSVKRGDAQRSYFGVYRVSESADGEFHVLTHGTTLHGAQRVRDSNGQPVLNTTPTTYYYPKSPMAKSIEVVRARLEAKGEKGRYGVVGLGTGSLSCYAKEGERWRIFEIDPVVIGISSNPRNFSFLANCQPNPDIVIGDARLTLAKEPSASYDLIIVDAFSSDAIPVHMLTADAMKMYADKLKPEGVVVLHISNRYLDLDSVLGANQPLVPELHGVLLSDDEADGSYASTTSSVGVFSKSADVIKQFRALNSASELVPGRMRGWTDDYSDILAPFLARLRQ